MINKFDRDTIIFDNITPEIQQLMYSVISSAIQNGLEFQAEKSFLKKRTISSYINDAICNNMEIELRKRGYAIGKVCMYNQGSSLRLSLGNGAVVIRFKKMNTAGVTSNIVTQTVLNFEESQKNLFGLADPININAGYVLLQGGLDYKILLSHPNGLKKTDWKYEILPGGNTINIPLPTSKTEGNTPHRQPKAKEGTKKDGAVNR